MENNKKSFVEQMNEYGKKLSSEHEELKNKISVLSSVEESLNFKAKRQLKDFKERVNEISWELEELKKDHEIYKDKVKDIEKSAALVRKERKADTKEKLSKSLEQEQKDLLKLENVILSKYNLNEANEAEVEVIEDEEDDYTDENERTTGSISKKKALFYTFISALSEPFGALLAYLFLYRFMSNTLISIVLLFVAGIMISISINDIFEEAKKYSSKYLFIGIILGIILIYLTSIF